MTRVALVAAGCVAACVPDHGPLMRPGDDCLECHGGGGVPGEALTVPDRESARGWTVAGTVFPSVNAAPDEGVRGAQVHLRDADGRVLTLETNRAGNFYTREPLRFPVRASVEQGGRSAAMEGDVEYGGCNGCHRQPPQERAPGRVSIVDDGEYRGPLMMPGENCLECHGGAMLPGEPATVANPLPAPRWTVAGTVFPFPVAAPGAGVGGARVTLVDADGATLVLETNAAGNFYTAAPLRFPLRASVAYGGVVQRMEPEVPYGGCNGCHRQPPRQDAPGRISTSGAGGD